MAKSDPFLSRLDAAAEQKPPAGMDVKYHNEAIATLYCLAYSEHKTGFDAFKAVVLSGRLGLPAPSWAIDLLEKAGNDTASGRTTLDVALGFRGEGSGGTKRAAVPQHLHAMYYETWCRAVLTLVRKGRTPEEACRLVAETLQTPDWNHSAYEIKPPSAETLLDHYKIWGTKIE